MSKSKYLTGDKEAIKEFIDRFDVLKPLGLHYLPFYIYLLIY